jgi:hypothetical protein
MKVEKNQKPSMLFGYLLELIKKSDDLETLFILKSDKFGPFFPLKILRIG